MAEIQQVVMIDHELLMMWVRRIRTELLYGAANRAIMNFDVIRKLLDMAEETKAASSILQLKPTPNSKGPAQKKPTYEVGIKVSDQSKPKPPTETFISSGIQYDVDTNVITSIKSYTKAQGDAFVVAANTKINQQILLEEQERDFVNKLEKGALGAQPGGKTAARRTTSRRVGRRRTSRRRVGRRRTNRRRHGGRRD